MKKTIIIISLLMSTYLCAYSQVSSYVTSSSVGRNKDGIYVKADMKSFRLKPGETVTITPYLYSRADTLELTKVEFCGRRRYIDWKRHNKNSNYEAVVVNAGNANEDILLRYEQNVPFFEWMQKCQLGYTVTRSGCNCKHPTANAEDVLTFIDYSSVTPPFVYAAAEKEIEKHRELTGSAKIEFPVNVMDLQPSFGSNFEELGNIVHSINSVSADSDINIKSITLIGSASPEGEFKRNKVLAHGRVESIKAYVLSLLQDKNQHIDTCSIGEDWEGVKRYIEASSLPHRDEILKVISQSLDPDAMEWKIKSNWPEDYSVMYKECYPGLRKTDYKIAYDIRQFTDKTDLLEIYETQPSKLSLYELMTLADGYEKESDEYMGIVETAIVLYPNNEDAAINAANVAMSKGDFASARKYLEKAGNTACATYAKAVYEYLSGNHEKAIAFMKDAADDGIQEAKDFLKYIERY